MKSLIILLFCFCYTSAFCDGPRYFIDEVAKPVVTWDPYENTTTGTGRLSCGDEILIQTTNTGELIVSSRHNEIKKELLSLPGEFSDVELGVYEYDFDNDGVQELILVYASDFYSSEIRVFRYSGGVSELVGNFGGQAFINIEGSVISLPIGSQGSRMEYLYRNGSFYDLVYHDPKKE